MGPLMDVRVCGQVGGSGYRPWMADLSQETSPALHFREGIPELPSHTQVLVPPLFTLPDLL